MNAKSRRDLRTVSERILRQVIQAETVLYHLLASDAGRPALPIPCSICRRPVALVSEDSCANELGEAVHNCCHERIAIMKSRTLGEKLMDFFEHKPGLIA
jgi:hypothetical protein